MAVVLAIEPDAKQASILKRVVRERARSEVTVVDSKDAAIAAIAAHVPDLILVHALLSPRDEEELVAHLRTLGDEADHLQTITIPLLAPAMGGEEGEDGFFKKAFGKRKRKPDARSSVGCDPWTFADQVAGYVKAATDLRVARQAELEYAARHQAHAEPPLTVVSEPEGLETQPPYVEPAAAYQTQDPASGLHEPQTAAAEPAFVDEQQAAAASAEPNEEPLVLPEPAYQALDAALAAPEPAFTAAPPSKPFARSDQDLAPAEPLIFPEPAETADDPAAAAPEPNVTPEPLVVPDSVILSETEAASQSVLVPESDLLPEPVIAPDSLVLPEPAAGSEPLSEPAAVAESAVWAAPLAAHDLDEAASVARPEPVMASDDALDEPVTDDVTALAEAALASSDFTGPLDIPTPVAAVPIAPAEPVDEPAPAAASETVVEEPASKTSRIRKWVSRAVPKAISRPAAAPPPPAGPEPSPAPVVVQFRPLKRLPPLFVWARLEEIAPLEPAKPIPLPGDDISDLFASLRVPPHVLPVTYPRRPHVRRVRAA